MKRPLFAVLFVFSLVACQKADRIANVSTGPLVTAAFKVTSQAPNHPSWTNEVDATGHFIGTEGPSKGKIVEHDLFDGRAFKMHENVELEVGPTGTVTNGRGKELGAFDANDVLVLKSGKRLRVLDDGRVVVEAADGSHQQSAFGNVEPATAQTRRAALLLMQFWLNPAPDLRPLLEAAH